MTVKAFAKKFDISEDEMWDALKDAGYLKKDYSPKTSFVNDELFDEDSNILDSKTLFSEMSDYFGNSEEDEEDYDEDEDYEDESEDEEDYDEEESEVTFDSVKESLDSLEASKEEIAELIAVLTDKLVNYEESSDEEDEDYEEDEDFEEEDEEDEKPKKKSKKSSDDEDPNAPGKYRGWVITKKGITITAKKGKKELKTSVRGNIRAKIDEEED